MLRYEVEYRSRLGESVDVGMGWGRRNRMREVESS